MTHDIERLIDNAATASQNRTLIDDPVTREAIKRNIIDPLLSASAALKGGMVLVPREPTEAMLDAYWHQTGESREMRERTHAYMRRYWEAMLTAALNGDRI